MNGAVKPNGEGLFEYGEHSHEKEYPKDHVPKEEVPYHEGKPHSHNHLDSKDQRSIKNRLVAEEILQDPTLPAMTHGNKPSKGAIIDAEIQKEEEEELAKIEAKQLARHHDGTHHSGKVHQK